MPGGHVIRKEVCFYSLLSAIDLGRPVDKAHPPPFWRNKHSEVAFTTGLGFLQNISSLLHGTLV